MLGTGGGDPGSSAGPFSSSSGACPPKPEERCGRNSTPVRVSKTVVQPGRKNGGTMLVFRLKRGAHVRFTIVRVYPSCKRIGSFSVGAHHGVNRVRFHGRFRGRPLPAGTYRLLVHARGQATPAAAVTIVVMRGKTSNAVVRRARKANSCSVEKAREIETSAGAAALGRNEGSNNPAALGKRLINRVVVGAVKGVAAKAQALDANIDDRFANPLIQTIVGLLTLVSACLGGLVLTRLRSRVLR